MMWSIDVSMIGTEKVVLVLAGGGSSSRSWWSMLRIFLIVSPGSQMGGGPLR